MPRKLAIKIAVDMVMTVLLLLLMAFSLIGETTHEWLGTMMCILLISHHILNAGWYKNMRKSRYSTFRVFQTALVGLLFLMMLGSMISGILLSRYVFNFLQVRVGWELMGSVHLFCAYWNFLLTGLHLGFHWSMVLGIIRKITGKIGRAHV